MLSVKLKVAIWATMAIFVPEAHGFNWFSSDPDESSLDAILGSNFANEESPLDHEAWKFERLLREGPIHTRPHAVCSRASPFRVMTGVRSAK